MTDRARVDTGAETPEQVAARVRAKLAENRASQPQAAPAAPPATPAQPQPGAAGAQPQNAPPRRSNQGGGAAPNRAPNRALPIPTRMYHKSGVMLALVCSLLLWIAVYFLNLFSTTWGVQPFWSGLLGGLNRMIALVEPEAVIKYGVTTLWVVGFLNAIVFTLIEVHLWKSGSRMLFYTIGLPVMLVDVYTSSLVCKILIYGYGPAALGGNFISTLLGEGMALLPEPMIVLHVVTLIRVLAERQRVKGVNTGW